jgi:hypothetical protein
MSASDSSSTPEWGNLRFDRRPRGSHASDVDAGATRFAIGISTFLVVALLYPWYSYWVNSRLLARDVTAGLEALLGEEREDEKQAREHSVRLQELARAQLEHDRIGRVSVRGISEQGGLTIAIVDLGSVRLGEARDTICQQVRRWRGRGSFEAVQVRRFRGTAPALTVGTIRCDR